MPAGKPKCEYQNGKRVCNSEALPGKTFCEGHACTTCEGGKSSSKKICDECTNDGPNSIIFHNQNNTSC